MLLLTSLILPLLTSPVARPSPVEFWLCASDFNPFNLLIEQPITKERCEVVSPPERSSAATANDDVGMPNIQYFG